jgi:hypothetical protein
LGGCWSEFQIILTKFADVGISDDSNNDDLNWQRLVGGARGKVEPELMSMQRRR